MTSLFGGIFKKKKNLDSTLLEISEEGELDLEIEVYAKELEETSSVEKSLLINKYGSQSKIVEMYSAAVDNLIKGLQTKDYKKVVQGYKTLAEVYNNLQRLGETMLIRETISWFEKIASSLEKKVIVDSIQYSNKVLDAIQQFRRVIENKLQNNYYGTR